MNHVVFKVKLLQCPAMLPSKLQGKVNCFVAITDFENAEFEALHSFIFSVNPKYWVVDGTIVADAYRIKAAPLVKFCILWFMFPPFLSFNRDDGFIDAYKEENDYADSDIAKLHICE